MNRPEDVRHIIRAEVLEALRRAEWESEVARDRKQDPDRARIIGELTLVLRRLKRVRKLVGKWRAEELKAMEGVSTGGGRE